MVTQRELTTRLVNKIANAEISQCPKCHCMTKTFNGKCGKCKEIKCVLEQETE